MFEQFSAPLVVESTKNKKDSTNWLLPKRVTQDIFFIKANSKSFKISMYVPKGVYSALCSFLIFYVVSLICKKCVFF